MNEELELVVQFLRKRADWQLRNGGERITQGLRLPISGVRKPSLRSTRTIVPGTG